MSEPIVVAQAGPKELQALQRVLHAASISSEIVCPSGVNTNA